MYSFFIDNCDFTPANCLFLNAYFYAFFFMSTLYNDEQQWLTMFVITIFCHPSGFNNFWVFIFLLHISFKKLTKIKMIIKTVVLLHKLTSLIITYYHRIIWKDFVFVKNNLTLVRSYENLPYRVIST